MIITPVHCHDIANFDSDAEERLGTSQWTKRKLDNKQGHKGANKSRLSEVTLDLKDISI